MSVNKPRKNIGQILVESKKITVEQYKQALRERKKGDKIGDVLLARGYISEKEYISALEKHLRLPYVALYKYHIKKNALSLISHDYAQTNYVMPLKLEDGVLTVAMYDPLNYHVIDNLELSTRLTIKPVISSKDDILFAINKYYVSLDKIDVGSSDRLDETVIRMFNQILTTAIQLRVSDIHIDPEAEYVAIRYRIDGQLRQSRKLPKDIHGPIIARVKILSDLDITQTRTPQDGRFTMDVNSKDVDLRVSCLPTVHGEKVVIRILDLSDANRNINNLGFSKSNKAKYEDLLKRPSGLVLLTGPTGSGKSSTLYASISHLNKDNVNIMTVEDPVEIQMEGINQVQVNTETGLTFAAGLRSILRQDPNIIMIGEIRDKDTAEIAIRSALTGHLVFSTLHTNSAIDAVPRLIDMGVEPYLVASSVKGVMAQRLVRRVCTACRKARKPTEAEVVLFAKHNKPIDVIHDAVGCDRCHRSGYRGRFAVHEIIMIDEKMKHILLEGGSSVDLHNYVISQGSDFLIDDGLDKVIHGLTTLDEVMQIATDL